MRTIKIAVLDMYEGVPNEGMRCIREILLKYAEMHSLNLLFDEFEVRLEQQVPDTSYDIYISTGGPGSPVDSEGSDWEKAYFHLVEDLMAWNNHHEQKKPMLFICHSYQIMCRYYKLGNVCKRKSPAFGVFPVHKTAAGMQEKVFSALPDPFYIVDSRNWQVIELNEENLAAMGAKVLAIEKERPHVPLERATMAIRFNDHFIGTQFHPEADAAGMHMYLLQEEKKEQVISHHGMEKYESMLTQLTDPDKIMLTHDRFITAFLDYAIYGALSERLATIERLVQVAAHNDNENTFF
ncbi:GMP synthase-like glutamine amidotransferase [Chitinophaga dinghuensis]|uniref:GMP synthase-like glutamine amidotransferase n=1 Tax=Chitinophaga dinghuensis TaxID=1539050 RepID=A0A327VKG0_9BACT|nr:GMP synthase [Chitinophaga dinghuensis]RAJ72832.1 GMP synthase-like glutamine amidotransferase [Chitinophaga dinghuensis]